MEAIKSLLSDFDLANILPDLEKLLGGLEMLLRVAVLVGPICLLGLGLWYLLAPIPEANHLAGYRCFWGMSSVEAWLFTQRTAGLVWTVLGAVLTIVMALRANEYRDLEYEEAIWGVIRSLGVELVLVIASIIVVNFTVFVAFDRKGYRRRKKRR